GAGRGRGDDRGQVGDLRELLGCHPKRLVDLLARHADVEVRPVEGGRTVLQQLVDVVAVALVGRDAAGRSVRVLEEPEFLEAGQLGPYRRRAPGDVRLIGEPAR